MNFYPYLKIFNFVSIFLIIIGFVWLIISIHRNVKINAINSWPKTNATILLTSWGEFSDPIYRTYSNFYGRNSFVNALFQYNANGMEYKSNNLYYGTPQKLTSEEARNLAIYLDTRKIVPVSYNPKNPSEAYIYNGTRSGWGIFWSIILIIIGLLIGIYNNKSIFKSKKKISSEIESNIEPKTKSNTKPKSEIKTEIKNDKKSEIKTSIEKKPSEKISESTSEEGIFSMPIGIPKIKNYFKNV